MARINTLDIKRAYEAGWTASDILDKMQEEDAILSDYIERKRKKSNKKAPEGDARYGYSAREDNKILSNLVIDSIPAPTFWDRLKIAFGDDEGIKKYLEKKGFHNVKKESDGNWSYSMGKKRKLVNPSGLDWGDVASAIPILNKGLGMTLGAVSGGSLGLAVGGAVGGPPGAVGGATGGAITGSGVGNTVAEFGNQSIGNLMGTRSGVDLMEYPKSFGEGMIFEILLGSLSKLGKSALKLGGKGLSITSGASEEAMIRQMGKFVDKKAVEIESKQLIKNGMSKQEAETQALKNVIAKGAEQRGTVNMARKGEISYKEVMESGGEELKKYKDAYQNRWKQSFKEFDANPELYTSGAEIKALKKEYEAILEKGYAYNPKGKTFNSRWGISTFAGKPEQARSIDELLNVMDRYSKIKNISPSQMNTLKETVNNFKLSYIRENAKFNNIVGELEGSVRNAFAKDEAMSKALTEYGDKVGKYDSLSKIFELDKDGHWDISRKLGQFRNLIRDYKKEGLVDIIDELSATSNNKNLIEQIKNIDAGVQMGGQGALRAQIGFYGGATQVMTGHPVAGLATWMSTRPSAFAPILSTAGKVMESPTIQGMGTALKSGTRSYLQKWANRSVETKVPVPQQDYNSQGVTPMQATSGSLY